MRTPIEREGPSGATGSAGTDDGRETSRSAGACGCPPEKHDGANLPLVLCPRCREGLIVADRFSTCGNCGLRGEELARALEVEQLLDEMESAGDESVPLVLGGQGRSPEEVAETGNVLVLLAGAAIGAVAVGIVWATVAALS